MRNTVNVFNHGRLLFLIRFSLIELIYSRSIKAHPHYFGRFFSRVIHSYSEGDDLSIKEKTTLIIFLDHCFNSLVSYIWNLSSTDDRLSFINVILSWNDVLVCVWEFRLNRLINLSSVKEIGIVEFPYCQTWKLNSTIQVFN